MTGVGTALDADRLRRLVEAESPTGDRTLIRRCLDLIAEWGAPVFGVDPELVSVDGVDHLYWPPRRSPSVLLLAHADTVWPAGTLDAWAYSESDGKARGPGVFDMKAGIVAALHAVSLVPDPERVSMLVTSDEETGSLTSRELIESAARAVDAVLVVEPSLDGKVKIARRGASIYTIRFEGVAAHAGLEPEKGASALMELAHQVLSLAELADARAGTSVTPTVARAGTTTNTVPADAALHVDVRGWTLTELERVHAAVANLQAKDPRVAIVAGGGVNRPPLEEESARPLLEIAQQVGRARGLPPVSGVAAGGASDGNFTGAIGVATLDGLGPLGGGAHARTEWVDLASISDHAHLIAGIIHELGNGRLGNGSGATV